ncbi:MAG: sigma-54-dependent transcriptional regulator [Dissulfurispiraceae bacterium]
MVRILAVDDEEPIRRLLMRELPRKGFSVESAPNGDIALKLIKTNTYDVVLLDIVMPGLDGISLMKKIRQDPAAPVIIVLTGRATVETAVDAMKHGAYDYLTKPYKLDELVIIVNRAFEFGQLTKKNRLLEQELIRQETPSDIIASSPQSKKILSLVRKIAPTASTVLIQGESGTGKEMIANAIWQHSKRSTLPFIALNCAAFSESLIESELFGHEKGAFTNAYQAKYGLVEVADKGTLFLDEISEMPLGLQANLLRFLDSGQYRRVGGNKILTVDTRVIAATNKNLAELIAAGRFREDLYYRLNVINITIPPLRERKEDIPDLSEFFLRKYGAKLSKNTSGFTAEVTDIFSSYDWPGNVRELENIIERAVILSDSEKIGKDDISLPAIHSGKDNRAHSSLQDMEKDHILKVLQEADGNQSKASQMLGIDRKTLYLKLKKYGII